MTPPRLVSRRRFAASVLGAATALLVNPLSAAPGMGIQGELAPQPRADFWIDANGHPTQFILAQQRGRWVHLKFWQSWCPGCHAHGFPALSKMVSAFANEPRVVNVALQTVFEGFGSNRPDRVRHTQLRYQLPITFGHDSANSAKAPGGGTMRLYRSGGTPWHVIVDPSGKVLYNGFGIDADQAISVIRRDLAQRPRP